MGLGWNGSIHGGDVVAREHAGDLGSGFAGRGRSDRCRNRHVEFALIRDEDGVGDWRVSGPRLVGKEVRDRTSLNEPDTQRVLCRRTSRCCAD